jgi:Flp pilus assembly protein TadD
MQQPKDTAPPRTTPLPAAVTRPLADGSPPHATEPPADPSRLAAPQAAGTWLGALAEDLFAPFLPDETAAWLSAQVAAWARRARWLALVTLLVLLPMAQWGSSADQLFASASAARSAWRYDHALADYARLAELDPTDPRPHCLQAQVLALQQLYAQALAAYATCEQLGESGPNTWLAQGDAANSGEQPGAAEHAWLRAVTAGSRTAHRRLALLYEQEGRLDDAATQWRALGPSDGQAQEHLGLLALQAGNYEAARAALVAARLLPGEFGQEAVDGGFVALAAQPPQDAAGFAALGGAFVQADLLTLARRPLDEAVTLDATDGPAHAYLAWVLLASGQVTDASTQAQEAVRLAPAMSFAWFAAAQVAMAEAQWSTALKDLQIGLSHDNGNPVLWAALGRGYIGAHDYIHAELSLSNAAQLGDEPEFTEQLLDFYVTHGVGQGLGRATSAASQALTRFPGNAQVALLAAEVYDLSNAVDQALVAYGLANALDPSLPDPYYYLGRFAWNGGQYDLAALDLRTYLALRPEGELAAQARKLMQPLESFDL